MPSATRVAMTWNGEPLNADSSAIPLFDLRDKPGVDAIEAACRTAGCFNMIGGGIDPGLTDALLDEMAAFFGLPDDHPVKRAVHRDQNEGANGWTPTLEEPAYEAGTIAWVESFDCVLSRAQIAALPENLARNIRPGLWPDMPGFRETVRAHWAAMTRAAELIFPLVSRMLKQDAGFLAARASSQALNTLRLLNYPRRPPALEAATDTVNKGISAHTDFECITLIHQTAPGLEVQTPRGEWVQAPVERGQWTVLLGDMVERWSNGTIKATPHRVPTTSWPRRSIVMFMAADPGLEVRPLEAFIDPAVGARFGSVTQDELINRAMARAEANRLAMAGEAEKIRRRISPG